MLTAKITITVKMAHDMTQLLEKVGNETQNKWNSKNIQCYAHN